MKTLAYVMTLLLGLVFIQIGYEDIFSGKCLSAFCSLVIAWVILDGARHPTKEEAPLPEKPTWVAKCPAESPPPDGLSVLLDNDGRLVVGYRKFGDKYFVEQDNHEFFPIRWYPLPTPPP